MKYALGRLSVSNRRWAAARRVNGSLGTVRRWAARLRQDAVALWIASGDRRTPWYAKALAVTLVAYAFSPIDLIPDVVPVIGQLDDLLLLPIGIWAAVALIPPALMEEFRTEAARRTARPGGRAGMVIVMGVWFSAAVVCGLIVWDLMNE